MRIALINKQKLFKPILNIKRKRMATNVNEPATLANGMATAALAPAVGGGQAVSIVLIETNGTIKTLKTKEVSPDSLYKKCGFRVSDDFLCRHTWSVKLDEHYIVSLWAKKSGKANFENKYDFPPPVDKDLFFGTCAIVRQSVAGMAIKAAKDSFLDLTKETWLKIYEKLFGGFEDIGDEDEYSEDELANVDPALLTADGYLKDDFVVSDKSGEVSEEEVPVKKIKAKKVIKDDVEKVIKKEVKKKDLDKVETKTKVDTKKKADAPKKKVKKPVKEEEEEVDEEDTSELEEEVYSFSDDD
jgi:hypothetical protein